MSKINKQIETDFIDTENRLTAARRTEDWEGLDEKLKRLRKKKNLIDTENR